MKKFVFLLAAWCAACLSVLPADADTRSAELLARLQRRVEQMPGYRVDFTVAAGGQLYEGYYSVRGNDYYMTFARAEVFGIGGVRYEVDPDKREVVIDETDPASRNLLNNPTRAFHLLDGSFTHALQAEAGGVATVFLTPEGKGGGFGRVRLDLESATALPQRIVYDLEGESVTVSVRSLCEETTPLKAFSAAAYPGFEIIDFR